MRSPEDLYRRPNALAPHYSAFRVQERLLLTGHSHQAWPDRGFEGQRRAWEDAAECVDEKWERAFERAARVRAGFARLLGDSADRIALASSTHDLVVRFLSACPLRERPRLVTTDGEFHTIRRQLDRLAEEGLEVVRVSRDPVSTVATRLAERIDDRTAAALVSSVFYEDARIVRGLGEVARACERRGAELLMDAYHSLNAVPLSLGGEGLEGAFVVGGGYKYCQLGEGNCFLRFPTGREFRPAITGWFSEFGALEGTRGAPLAGRGRPPSGPDGALERGTSTEREEGADQGPTPVVYGRGPDRFAGSTYDPTSHYRAAEVFAFFEEEGLAPEFLREVSQHQVGLLAERFDELDADPRLIRRDRSMDLGELGGFLALRSPRAAEISRLLRERDVRTDHRGELLRLGPAPYLCDDQLREAMAALGEVVGALSRG